MAKPTKYLVKQHNQKDDRIVVSLQKYNDTTDVLDATVITIDLELNDVSRSISEKDVITVEDSVICWEPVARDGRKLLTNKIQLIRKNVAV
jgi:hypothetical protein